MDILSSFHSNLFEIFEGHIITNNGIISSASALREAFDDANDRINLCERTFSFFPGTIFVTVFPIPKMTLASKWDLMLKAALIYSPRVFAN